MANKKYAKLDQLTTAELESILRADLSDVESDPELIDHVLEVILRTYSGRYQRFGWLC